ncbi:MAG: GNAT family N-acetyltransferase [Treponema sp.]|jgi:ribosomal protein S18 acetylase RimI-like enzyme|nr:GNAT family N-acetyltransferase [Treponema sp.]
MQFELTEALVNNILFSMEDQNGDFALDTREGVLVNKDDEGYEEQKEDDEDGNRFISLPYWGPAEGYRLMEKFAAALKNTLIRKSLTAALERGKGVFRAFKDVLGSYPEAEQLWFTFKEREMRRVILDWYNACREEWGLARLGDEPEETEDLVLEDFRFRPPESRDSAAMEKLRRFCLAELIAAVKEGGPGDRPSFVAGWAERLGPAEPLLVAESGAGEFAGYAAAVRRGDTLHITTLEVKAEYRGLGLGEMILTRLLETAPVKKAAYVVVELPHTAGNFSRVLLRKSFVPFAASYVLQSG